MAISMSEIDHLSKQYRSKEAFALVYAYFLMLRNMILCNSFIDLATRRMPTSCCTKRKKADRKNIRQIIFEKA